MGPRLFRRGNQLQLPGLVRVDGPSMGPRLFRRGNAERLFVHSGKTLLQWGHVFSDVEIPNIFFIAAVMYSPFNGATSFQTWKSRQMIARKLEYGPFNGATSFQTWKFPCPRREHASKEDLQWGHVFSDVEIWPRMVSQASRERLQWGHVFSDVEIEAVGSRQATATAFNGATSFQTWKYRHIVDLGDRLEVLQWGHVFSDVEIA